MKYLFTFLSMLLLANDWNPPDLCNNPKEISVYFNTFGEFSDIISNPITIVEDQETDHLNVENYANLLVRDNWGNMLDLGSLFGNELIGGIEEGLKSIAIISKNENFCSMELQEKHKSILEEYQFSIFVHIWENPIIHESDSMYVIYNYSYLNSFK